MNSLLDPELQAIFQVAQPVVVSDKVSTYKEDPKVYSAATYIPPQDGWSQDGWSQDGLSQEGLSQEGLSREAISDNLRQWSITVPEEVVAFDTGSSGSSQVNARVFYSDGSTLRTVPPEGGAPSVVPGGDNVIAIRHVCGRPTYVCVKSLGSSIEIATYNHVFQEWGKAAEGLRFLGGTPDEFRDPSPNHRVLVCGHRL